MASSLNAHRYTKPLILTSAVLGIILLSLPFLSREPIAEVGLTALAGRFHPLIVHFPIVLIVLPLILEGLTYWQKWTHLKGALLILWPLAIISSSAAAFMGYFLFRAGDYAGDTAKGRAALQNETEEKPRAA